MPPSSEPEEAGNLPHGGQDTHVLYTRRWYVLFVFCIVVTCQNAFWNTFGAIEPFAAQHYSTTKSMINFLSSLGPIVFIPFSFASVWFVDRFGIRKTVLCCSILSASGGLIRCLYFHDFKYNIMFPIIGQTLNNAAGPVTMMLQPKISSVWFAPSERTLSTAISFQSNVIGLAGSYFISMMVKKSTDVPFVLYIYASVGVFGLILALVYFPEKPPSPPSISGEMSGTKKVDNSPLTVFKNSFDCLKTPAGLVLIVFGACPGGVYSGWMAMVVEIVRPLGYSENQAESFGLYAMIAGGIGGVLFGKAHDMYRHYKTWLIGLIIANFLCFFWFSLTMAKILPGAYVVAQIANILGGFLIGAPSGILYEGIVELTYPIPEQTGVNLYAIIFNLWTLVFLVIGDYLTPTVMNWSLCGAFLVTFVTFLPVKERYPRSYLDDKGYMPVQ